MSNYISTMGRTAYIRVNGNGDYPIVPFAPASANIPGYLAVVCELPSAPSIITATMDTRGRVTLRRAYPLYAWQPPRTARIITRAYIWRDQMSSLVIEVRDHSKAGCTLRISGVPEFVATLPEPAAPGTTQ